MNFRFNLIAKIDQHICQRILGLVNKPMGSLKIPKEHFLNLFHSKAFAIYSINL